MSLPCFIISLPNSPRRQAVVENLAKVGITEPVFFDAVDGARLTAEQQRLFEESQQRYFFHRHKRAGAMGASLSHIGVWQKMIDEGVECAVVFEDDAEPTADGEAIADCLDTLLALQDRLDVVFLSKRKDTRFTAVGGGLEVNRKGDARAKDSHANGQVGFEVARKGDDGAEAYFITRRAAEYLLAHPRRFAVEIDRFMHHWWHHFPHFAPLYYATSLFRQNDSPSTIGYDTPHRFYPKGVVMALLVFIARQTVSVKKRLLFPAYTNKIRQRLNGEVNAD